MEQSSNKKAITSLVLGIISCVCSVCYIIGWIAGLVCGILAIIFGVKARKQAPCGMATAGFVLGIVGTSLCGVTLLGAICFLMFISFL